MGLFSLDAHKTMHRNAVLNRIHKSFSKNIRVFVQKASTLNCLTNLFGSAEEVALTMSRKSGTYYYGNSYRIGRSDFGWAARFDLGSAGLDQDRSESHGFAHAARLLGRRRALGNWSRAGLRSGQKLGYRSRRVDRWGGHDRLRHDAVNTLTR